MMTIRTRELPSTNDVTPLRRLGWNAARHLFPESGSPENGTPARVLSAQRGRFLVSDGESEWLCAPAGRLLRDRDADYPVTGDWVLVRDAVVRRVLPRRNVLARGGAGTRGNKSAAPVREQPMAANLDTVFLVCGLDRDFNLRRLERAMALVYNCGIAPVIVLTKADLHLDPEPFRLQAEAVAFGVPVVLASMLDGRGRQELEAHLGPGRTAAMIGSSGAGKSTLANMLHGSAVRATAEVSRSVGKGRHTTTSRELIVLPGGGMLVDNPGIREIALFADGEGLDSAFADIRELAGRCRFADCAHESEPGCAVLRAAERGELPPERLESYRRMRRELQHASERREKGSERVEKERWRGVALEQKRMKKRR